MRYVIVYVIVNFDLLCIFERRIVYRSLLEINLYSH